MKINRKIKLQALISFIAILLFLTGIGHTDTNASLKEQELDKLQKEFSWWPTDAKPTPVKDEGKGGYWWWPNEPGKVGPLWGNRGYCYVYKIIFDYKEEELPSPKEKELRPSLIIKKIIKNVKVYFDYNKAEIRDDAASILEDAVKSLNKNKEADILITGNCDRRGSEAYNEKLGRKRGESVKRFMLDRGIPEDRIRIVSRGKLDAVSPITDLIGMQKDRNAQFMVAEVQEVMIPYNSSAQGNQEAIKTEEELTLPPEGKVVEEKEEVVEGQVKVSTKEYIVKKGDTLWKIAQEELGNGYRWKYLYELNKEKIKNPNRLKAGQKIIIPVE